MKCPHCDLGIHEAFAGVQLAQYGAVSGDAKEVAPGTIWTGLHQRCPECHEVIIYLNVLKYGTNAQVRFMVYPAAASRPIRPEVVEPYRKDFAEACAVLPHSPKASAALSRRCLQALLKDKGKATKRDLNDQIDEVVGSGGIPSYIADNLHAVRNIGNFAAHQIKSTNTADIVSVEDGEAEWNLDVLESLFDLYFVQPAVSAKRKSELNRKLRDAGKPELK
ncbi:MAG TPA: DUF4145 domain-containing protein [Bryobacteraceae bacterium]|jgi:hypothetical protein|nr:DUF4145 domain-containing protein [Bryobacteraceae bacterium]